MACCESFVILTASLSIALSKICSMILHLSEWVSVPRNNLLLLSGPAQSLSQRASPGWSSGSITSVQNRQAAGSGLLHFSSALPTALKAALNFIPGLHSIITRCADMTFWLLNSRPIDVCDKAQRKTQQKKDKDAEEAISWAQSQRRIQVSRTQETQGGVTPHLKCSIEKPLSCSIWRAVKSQSQGGTNRHVQTMEKLDFKSSELWAFL